MMQAIDLLKFSEKILKSLSEIGVKIDDCKYIGMYNEYKELIRKGVKKEYARATVAEKHKTSQTTVYRVISRLEKHIKI